MTEEEGSFKVKDRRRFDSAGNEREQQEVGASKQVAQVKQSNATDSARVTPGVIVDQERENLDNPNASEIEFSAFVMSLATQALMQLGVMQPPAGVQVPVDREAAKQTIEILSMLKVKTQGNLDKEETKLFEDILHSLRMSYVKVEAP